MFNSLFRLFSKSKDDDDDDVLGESSCESTSAESMDDFCTPQSQLRDNNNSNGGDVSSRTPLSPVTLITNDQDEQKSNDDKEDFVPLEEVVQSGLRNEKIREIPENDKDHNNLPPCQDEFSGFTCYTSSTTKEEVHSAHDKVEGDEVIHVRPDNSNDCLVDQPTPDGSTCFSSPAISNLVPIYEQQSSGISHLSSSSLKIRDLCSKFQNMTISEKGLDRVVVSQFSLPTKMDQSFVLSGKPYNYVVPPKISRMMRHCQRDGLKWLWGLHSQGKGGILGDDVGKTIQMCIFFTGLFHSRLVRRVLIVVPKPRLAHWIKVLNTVGLSGKIREYSGASVKARKQALQYIFQNNVILLTTYGIVGHNFKSIRGDSYAISERNDDGLIWDYSILDEGHQIKNPRTKRSKSLVAIPSSHRIILCSRPIHYNLKELWALFRFCCPELLGDEKEFKDTYGSAITRGKRKNATSKEKRKGDAVAKDLREHIKPYLLQTLEEGCVSGQS